MYQERMLVPAQSKDISLPPNIYKDQVGVLPIWFGRQPEEFDHNLFYGRFRLYPEFVLEQAARITNEPYPALAQMDIDLRRVLTNIYDPLAVVIVSTGFVSELKWVLHTSKGLRQLRQQQGLDSTSFIYHLVLGSGLSNPKSKRKDILFSDDEIRANELGASYLYYDDDYPSAGTSRLVEFMNRLLGFDLPGKWFPNYSQQMLVRLAWHISREDFNAHHRRLGAIPKYRIVDGWPEILQDLL